MDLLNPRINPGIEPGSPALQADSIPTELSGKPEGESSPKKGGKEKLGCSPPALFLHVFQGPTPIACLELHATQKSFYYMEYCVDVDVKCNLHKSVLKERINGIQFAPSLMS